jgi:transposase-like protein
MKRRGLNDPLLVTSDGAPGIIKAIDIAQLRFPVTHRRAIRTTNLLERFEIGPVVIDAAGEIYGDAPSAARAPRLASFFCSTG